MAPYETLRNRLIDFATMQQLRRFARFWELVANSGRFVETAPLIWGQGSPFAGFLRCTEWLHRRIGRRHGIALDRLAELLFEFLSRELGLEEANTAAVLWGDYLRVGHRDPPRFLRPHLPAIPLAEGRAHPRGPLSRQARHQRHGKTAFGSAPAEPRPPGSRDG